MVQKQNEDLFESTKMSFGEHLEELRVVLFRALIGLIVGFLIGLWAAEHVVKFIQKPLVDALQEHYSARAIARLEALYGKENISKELRDFVKDNRIIYEDLLIEASELSRIIEMAQAPPTAKFQAPTERLPLPQGHLVQARFWKRLDPKITTLSAQEAFMIWLKAGFVTGLLVASPYMVYQVWVFIAAGLYPHEKKYVYVFLPFSLALFWSGTALAFFFVFRYVLNFLLGFNQAMNIESEPRISEWISFVLMLPIGFGVAFQLPLVMLLLHRIGLVTIQMYLEKWRIAVLAIFVIAMILTPADPISMLMMACPLVLLYFLGIALCHWMPRSRNPFRDAYDPT